MAEAWTPNAITNDKGAPRSALVIGHRKLWPGAGMRQRIGAISFIAFTAPAPMAAPKRLASRSATLSRGV
jgi:hypothetical protein